MNLVVRDADIESDADAIADAHVASWRAGYAHVFPESLLYGEDFEPSRRRQWHSWHPTPRHHLLVAEIDGRVVGFCNCGDERERDGTRPDRGEVYSFYLHPDAWGTGAAAALMAASVERLRADGHRQATLWVLDDNPRARAFYEHAGWQTTGRSVPLDLYCDQDAPEVEYLVDLVDPESGT